MWSQSHTPEQQHNITMVGRTVPYPDHDIQKVCPRVIKIYWDCTVSNFNFFPMHKWVVEQLKEKKKRFCICFPILMKLMTLLINKNFTTLGSHDPRQWMKIPRSQLQWTLISSHLALYFASTPNF